MVVARCRVDRVVLPAEAVDGWDYLVSDARDWGRVLKVLSVAYWASLVVS